MFFAEIFGHPQALLLGMALLVLAWSIRRGRGKVARDIRGSFETASLSARTSASEKVVQQKLHEAETRLYEFSREVEARIANQISLLDVLVREADSVCQQLDRLMQRLPPEISAQDAHAAAPDQDTGGAPASDVARLRDLLQAAGHGAPDSAVRNPITANGRSAAGQSSRTDLIPAPDPPQRRAA